MESRSPPHGRAKDKPRRPIDLHQHMQRAMHSVLLHACKPASLPACLLACQPACLTAGLPPCSRTRWPQCKGSTGMGEHSWASSEDGGVAQGGLGLDAPASGAVAQRCHCSHSHTDAHEFVQACHARMCGFVGCSDSSWLWVCGVAGEITGMFPLRRDQPWLHCVWWIRSVPIAVTAFVF